MSVTTRIIRGLALLVIAMLVIPAAISAQDFGQPEQTDRFGKEELDQMLAPIALYPDSLIAQMLMASTYPLEVVQAERWLKQNPSLTGDALDEALKEKTWDPSIKSLCHFPDVLFAMSDKLDQTRKLGDAFLSQQDDVMETIQALRRKAELQGNLKTTEEQNVIHEADAIRIEPAHRQIVYVPVYDPLYVYGPWWYPAYPPYYWYYPARVRVTGSCIYFGPRFFFGINLFSWSWFDWHRHQIYIDVHKARRFHKFRTIYDSNRYFWRHNPTHRRGVAYRKGRIREQFGQKPTRKSPPGSIIRGYTAKANKRRTAEPSRGKTKLRKKADVPLATREQHRIQRPDTRRETAGAPRATPERKRLEMSDGRTRPLHGSGNGKLEPKTSERGVQSPRSGKSNRQDGGKRREGGNVPRDYGRSLSGGQGVGRIGQGFFR